MRVSCHLWAVTAMSSTASVHPGERLHKYRIARRESIQDRRSGLGHALIHACIEKA